MKPKNTAEGIERMKAFHQWCDAFGYFPHSKYYEAFIAGINYQRKTQQPA